jgi:hypothetical protein
MDAAAIAIATCVALFVALRLTLRVYDCSPIGKIMHLLRAHI